MAQGRQEVTEKGWGIAAGSGQLCLVSWTGARRRSGKPVQGVGVMEVERSVIWEEPCMGWTCQSTLMREEIHQRTRCRLRVDSKWNCSNIHMNFPYKTGIIVNKPFHNISYSLQNVQYSFPLENKNEDDATWWPHPGLHL